MAIGVLLLPLAIRPAQAEASRGETASLLRGAWPDHTGRRWAVRVGGDEWRLWVVDTSTGDCVPLPSQAGGLTTVTWRPDSDNQIAFIGSGRDPSLTVFDVDHMVGRTLPYPAEAERRWCSWPQWSRDGSLLAFYGPLERNGRRVHAVFSVVPDGSAAPKLEVLGVDGPLAWCWGKDTSTILYRPRPTQSSRPGPMQGIGRPLPESRLTGSVLKMVLSPSGSLVARLVALEADAEAGEIAVLDESLEREVWRSPVLRHASGLVWSPDGRHILTWADGPSGKHMPIIVSLASPHVTALTQPELKGAVPAAWIRGTAGQTRMYFTTKRSLLATTGPGQPVEPVTVVNDRGVPKLAEGKPFAASQPEGDAVAGGGFTIVQYRRTAGYLPAASGHTRHRAPMW